MLNSTNGILDLTQVRSVQVFIIFFFKRIYLC